MNVTDVIKSFEIIYGRNMTLMEETLIRSIMAVQEENIMLRKMISDYGPTAESAMRHMNLCRSEIGAEENEVLLDAIKRIRGTE